MSAGGWKLPEQCAFSATRGLGWQLAGADIDATKEKVKSEERNALKVKADTFPFLTSSPSPSVLAFSLPLTPSFSFFLTPFPSLPVFSF